MYADALNEVFRYAQKASLQQYHQMLEKAPEKGDAASGLYADHLRSSGLHAHADFIERAASHTGYGVNKFDAAGSDHEIPAGEWKATVGSFGGGHSVNLFQKSLHNPNVMFGWSHVGPADEVAEIVRKLKDEGTEAELVSDAHPNAEKRLRVQLGLDDPEPQPEADVDDADWWKHKSFAEALKYGLEDHSSFQQKIAEDVDEHTPQLVYADWLEEQGKPAHAQFIRRSVEGQKDRWDKVSSGQEFGTLFPTTAHPHAVGADFATHGMLYKSGDRDSSNVDLSSQYVHPDGTRLIWHVGGLSPEEGRKLRDALAAEGAVPSAISNDKDDPHWQKHLSEPYKADGEVLKYTTADHSDFHRAMTAEPEENVHHFAYADFLQENGQPEEADIIRRAASEGHILHLGVGDYVHLGQAGEFNRDQTTANMADGRKADCDRLISRNAADPERSISWYAPYHFHKQEDPDLYAVTDEALKYSAGPEEFHNAIHSEPAEGLHALAYADYLEENDKPAHAEVLRHHVKREGNSGEVQQLPEGFDGTYGRPPLHAASEVRPVYDHYAGSEFDVPPVVGWRVSLNQISPNTPLPSGAKASQVSWITPIMEKTQAMNLHKRLLAEGAADHSIRHVVAEEPEKHRASDGVVKYSAVPNHEIHPDYQPTGVAPRIGHLLKQLSAENTDAGLLAEGIARTGDHSLLKILADKLDDDGHPLKDAIDWRHAERGMKIDRALSAEIGSHHNLMTVDGLTQFVPQSAGWTLSDWKSRTRGNLSRKRALDAVRKHVPDASRHDLHHSVLRLLDNQFVSELHNPESQFYRPSYVEGAYPPKERRIMHKQYLKELGSEEADAHQYPDTRPANKRTYSLKELVAKYRVVKYRLRTAEELKPFVDTLEEHYQESKKQEKDNGVFFGNVLKNYTDRTKLDLSVLRDFLQDEGDVRHIILTKSLEPENEPHFIGHPEASRHLAAKDGHYYEMRIGRSGTGGYYDVVSGRTETKPAVKVGWWPEGHTKKPSENPYGYLATLTPEEARNYAEGLPEEVGSHFLNLLNEHFPQKPEKYGAYKSPVGGLVVKESPYAVVGNYSTGGTFTRDLTQLNTEPAETQPQKPKLAELLRRWRKRRTK